MSNSSIRSTTKTNGEDREPSPDADVPPLGTMSEEEIDYNIMASFPASDPPSWTLGLRARKSFQTDFEGEKPGPHEPSHQNE